MYYLQSRYYDANVGRFINADDPEFAKIPENILMHNLYAYCCNDVVNDIDESGCISLNGLLNYFTSALNRLKNKLIEYINSLMVFGYRMVKISTVIISYLVDSVVSLVLSFWLSKTIKGALRIILNTYLKRNTGKLASIAKSIIKFLLNSFIGRMIIRLVAGKIVSKTGLRPSLKNTIISEIKSNIIEGFNKLAYKTYTVISAFSSIGGIIALFLDLFDKNIDGYVTIRY